MKTIYYTAMSLDGFLADEHHGLDWLMQFGEVGTDAYAALMRSTVAVAMGSNTYEWILRHLAATPNASQQLWPYTQPTWVFSSRKLPSIPGADIRFVSGDVSNVYAEITRVTKDAAAALAAGDPAALQCLWLVGGGELVGQFHDAALLDEIEVGIAPVTLGKGQPFLPRRIATPPLQLLNTASLGMGFVSLRYAVPKPSR